jgi:hypothetical protein
MNFPRSSLAPFPLIVRGRYHHQLRLGYHQLSLPPPPPPPSDHPTDDKRLSEKGDGKRPDVEKEDPIF